MFATAGDAGIDRANNTCRQNNVGEREKDADRSNIPPGASKTAHHIEMRLYAADPKEENWGLSAISCLPAHALQLPPTSSDGLIRNLAAN